MKLRLFMVLAAWLQAATLMAADDACREQELALQVLGSGGPIPDDARSASGYLVWRQGKAIALIDAGGGVFQRFGMAGASLDDLEIIALTHFHTDHSADLPALMKGLYFSARKRPLVVAGPDGSGLWPSLDGFLHRLFSKDAGAFGYLHGLLDGSDPNLPPLKAITVEAAAEAPVKVLEQNGLTVRASGIHHGPVPAVGYLLEVAGRRIAISGDQNLETDHFLKMVQGADVFVMPMPIPERAEPVGLHARPSDIGRAAAIVRPGSLVLSHWMARSLRDQTANIARVRRYFGGRIQPAEDGFCLPLN